MCTLAEPLQPARHVWYTGSLLYRPCIVVGGQLPAAGTATVRFLDEPDRVERAAVELLEAYTSQRVARPDAYGAGYMWRPIVPGALRDALGAPSCTQSAPGGLWALK